MCYRVADLYPLMEQVLASGGQFQMYPRGTSMLPLVRQGRDFVYLEALHRPPRRDDILLFRRADGAFVLHRVWCVRGGLCTMLGDNQTVCEPGISTAQIVAVATGLGRDGAQPKPHSTGSRLYRLLWCRSLLLRRCVLFIKRHARLQQKETHEKN